jgi:hypothetical protein
MFGAFQSNAFQANAFQIIASAAPPVPDVVGDSVFVPSHQRHNIKDQSAKVTKAKTDLNRIDSVIKETEKKKALAAQSALLARQRESIRRAIELEAAETEFLNEINRLLMVRAELVKRVRAEEETLLILMVAKRRMRFAIQPASRSYLH